MLGTGANGKDLLEEWLDRAARDEPIDALLDNQILALVSLQMSEAQQANRRDLLAGHLDRDTRCFTTMSSCGTTLLTPVIRDAPDAGACKAGEDTAKYREYMDQASSNDRAKILRSATPSGLTAWQAAPYHVSVDKRECYGNDTRSGRCPRVPR